MYTVCMPVCPIRALFNQIRFSRHPHSGCVDGVGGGTVLELSNPRAALVIIPKRTLSCIIPKADVKSS
jgi:hypothetical protein